MSDKLPTLYVILGSHACRSGILMCDHKGIDYRTVTLPTGMHPFLVRLAGFPARVRRSAGGRRQALLALADRFGTVPALRYGDERIQTNREIARFLDRVVADPPLFPVEREERERVEEAERWADETFQMMARRLGLAAVLHGPDAMFDRGSDGRLGPLLWKREGMRRWGVPFVGRTTFAADADGEQQLLEALPAALDHIDSLVGSGTIGGSELHAADFMIAPSLALLDYRRDLRAELESRPSWELVERLLPEPASAAASVGVGA